MTMTNYVQLFVFALYLSLMKLYGFVNFIEQHLVPYEYASVSLVIIEGDLIVWWGLTSNANNDILMSVISYYHIAD